MPQRPGLLCFSYSCGEKLQAYRRCPPSRACLRFPVLEVLVKLGEVLKHQTVHCWTGKLKVPGVDKHSGFPRQRWQSQGSFYKLSYKLLWATEPLWPRVITAQTRYHLKSGRCEVSPCLSCSQAYLVPPRLPESKSRLKFCTWENSDWDRHHLHHRSSCVTILSCTLFYSHMEAYRMHTGLLTLLAEGLEFKYRYLTL